MEDNLIRITKTFLILEIDKLRSLKGRITRIIKRLD